MKNSRSCSCCINNSRKMKKGLWSPDEDEKLKEFVSKHGIKRWNDVPLQAGLDRCGKSCRLRWMNYLKPGLKRGKFSPEERKLVFLLHSVYGNSWSRIAKQIPGRTDNEVKNFWNTEAHRSARKKQSDGAMQGKHISSYRMAVPFKIEIDEPELEDGRAEFEAPVMQQEKITGATDWSLSEDSSVESMSSYDFLFEAFSDVGLEDILHAPIL